MSALQIGFDPELLRRLYERRGHIVSVTMCADGSGYLGECGDRINGTDFGGDKDEHTDANAAIRSLLPPTPLEDLETVISATPWTESTSVLLARERLREHLAGMEYPT